jgi:RNA polymerase sigma-70 factor, ECF subfamily
MQIDELNAGKNEAFLALRPILFAVAYQMLGNASDAEDMVQESFLRWEKTDGSKVRSPRAFLTTIVTRLCLKHLQSARFQREEYFGSAVPEFLETEQVTSSSEHAQLADSLSVALLVVLKALSPLERAVFLLRELFDTEYSEIADIVGKSEENCRQILRRARDRIASRKPRYQVMPQKEEQIVGRFMQAVAEGNWAELVEVLSDDVTLVCDGSNLGEGPLLIHGTESVLQLIQEKASRWLGHGALLQMLYFQSRPVILAYRNGVPVSSIFLSIDGAELRSVCVITCPVRLRSLLIHQGLCGKGP